MAKDYDLPVEQGATLELELNLADDDGEPINVSGWEFRGQIREHYDSEEILASFEFEILEAVSGQVRAFIQDEDTAEIPVNESESYKKKITKYCYDIEAEKPDGSVIRLMEGTALVSPEATRS